MDANLKASDTDVAIDRDVFLRKLIRELAGSLEEVVGLNEASGFISIVGQNIGDWMNEEYRQALQTALLSPQQVSETLVDLKRRINGDFYLISEDNDKIILGNRRCPFGSKVKDRPSMCMMTSNVFGTVTAENLGFAKVCLHETIAAGSTECRVTVHKNQTTEAENDEGRTYYKS
jgi:predicted ArsR family transcriptional regulator